MSIEVTQHPQNITLVDKEGDLWLTQFGPPREPRDKKPGPTPGAKKPPGPSSRAYCQHLTVTTDIPVEQRKTLQLALVGEEDFLEAVETGQVKVCQESDQPGDSSEVQAWKSLRLRFHTKVANILGKQTVEDAEWPTPERLVVSREFLVTKAKEALQPTSGKTAEGATGDTQPVEATLCGEATDQSYAEFKFKFIFTNKELGPRGHYRLLFFIDYFSGMTPETIKMLEEFELKNRMKKLKDDWCECLRLQDWDRCCTLVDNVSNDQINWIFSHQQGRDTATLLLLLVEKSHISEEDDRRICGIIDKLVDKGCEVNFQNESGTTAMHKAGTAGSISVYEKLLSVQGNAKIRTTKGKYLPLHNAMSNSRTKHPDFVRKALQNYYADSECNYNWEKVRELTCDPGMSKALNKHVDLDGIGEIINEFVQTNTSTAGNTTIDDPLEHS